MLDRPKFIFGRGLSTQQRKRQRKRQREDDDGSLTILDALQKIRTVKKRKYTHNINGRRASYTPTITVEDVMEDEIQLNDQQLAALNDALEGKSLMITGAAGTGKSELSKRIKKALQDEKKKRVTVTGPTGVSAKNVGGTTLHSKFGLPSVDYNSDEVFKKVIREYKWKNTNNRKKWKIWKETDVLIIDEISMVPRGLFKALHEMACWARGQANIPFGGVQLILCGDFHQLPPITRKLKEKDSVFCFLSTVWEEIFDQRGSIILLEEIFRQSADLGFIQLLNRLRSGEPTAEDWSLLDGRLRAIEYDNNNMITNEIVMSIGGDEQQDGEKNSIVTRAIKNQWKKMIHLCPTNREASGINDKEFHILEKVFGFQEFCKVVKYFTRDNLERRAANGAFKEIEQEIQLTVGCRVMLTRNLRLGTDQMRDELKLVNGSLGTVLDSNSQGCVVLFDSVRNQALSKGITDPWDMRTELIEKVEWHYENQLGVKIATCCQIPLLKAWAITIHKSQGLQFDEIAVNMNCFADGQAYVAVSRVKSLDGLHLMVKPKRSIRTSQVVKDFYLQLVNMEISK